MVDIKGFVQRAKRKIMGAVVAASVVCMAVVPCFAADTTPPDVTTVMTEAATKLTGELMTMVAAVLGAVILLFGLKIGITYGLRFIKQLIGKAS